MKKTKKTRIRKKSLYGIYGKLMYICYITLFSIHSLFVSSIVLLLFHVINIVPMPIQENRDTWGKEEVNGYNVMSVGGVADR